MWFLLARQNSSRNLKWTCAVGEFGERGKVNRGVFSHLELELEFPSQSSVAIIEVLRPQNNVFRHTEVLCIVGSVYNLMLYFNVNMNIYSYFLFIEYYFIGISFFSLSPLFKALFLKVGYTDIWCQCLTYRNYNSITCFGTHQLFFVSVFVLLCFLSP